ncbi:MAG: hypothetical protein V2G37_07110, partial [bacterium JZ-2024 1]
FYFTSLPLISSWIYPSTHRHWDTVLSDEPEEAHACRASHIPPHKTIPLILPPSPFILYPRFPLLPPFPFLSRFSL